MMRIKESIENIESVTIILTVQLVWVWVCIMLCINVYFQGSKYKLGELDHRILTTCSFMPDVSNAVRLILTDPCTFGKSGVAKY